jgi:hypothetical protein
MAIPNGTAGTIHPNTTAPSTICLNRADLPDKTVLSQNIVSGGKASIAMAMTFLDIIVCIIACWAAR